MNVNKQRKPLAATMLKMSFRQSALGIWSTVISELLMKVTWACIEMLF